MKEKKKVLRNLDDKKHKAHFWKKKKTPKPTKQKKRNKKTQPQTGFTFEAVGKKDPIQAI